jgi:hypothetical protein
MKKDDFSNEKKLYIPIIGRSFIAFFSSFLYHVVNNFFQCSFDEPNIIIYLCINQNNLYEYSFKNLTIKVIMNTIKMLFFFIGFLFGVFVAQESPSFPNIKNNITTTVTFIRKMVVQDSMPTEPHTDDESKKDS